MKIERRGFFAAIAGLFCFKRSNRWSDSRWGNQHLPGNLYASIRTRYEVHFNGVEVTNRCFYFHEGEGVVGLYKHRYGHPYVNETRTGVETEWKRGRVELILKDADISRIEENTRYAIKVAPALRLGKGGIVV